MSTKQALKEASKLKDETPFSEDSGPNAYDRMEEWLASDRRLKPGTPFYSERRTAVLQLVRNGYDIDQWPCVDRLIWHESGWDKTVTGSDSPGGLPAAFPASKMAEAGPKWATHAGTQLKWFYSYVSQTYGSPCAAWDAWMDRANNEGLGWY